ncbi:MAG: hypothetical protein HOV79_21840 [Hamadaea sp.]|nr:hypothetical protein [Hamadaea sp.]
MVGWTVTTHPPDEEAPLICGFFLTGTEALHASIDLVEAVRREPVRPMFAIAPVYAAEPVNMMRVLYRPSGRMCRVTGCHARVGNEGYDGYCVDCADEIFGLPPETDFAAA